ncbi:hypothetical protein EVAR_87734_1 [Eumeta japonica]|uniref:Uncharacterized protein n=1 Tax=Eumeta variegata TaxID=151549 RepID=A0A4C1ZNQ6_EUMVA|nr:hypothetical protein EVAR_87734_1 [Eumeta japonica]
MQIASAFKIRKTNTTVNDVCPHASARVRVAHSAMSDFSSHLTATDPLHSPAAPPGPRRGIRQTENCDFWTVETDVAAYQPPPPCNVLTGRNRAWRADRIRRARSRVTAARVALRTSALYAFGPFEGPYSARVRVCHIRVPLGNAAEPVSARRTADHGRRCAGVVRRLDCNAPVRRNCCIRAPPDTATEPVGARPWNATRAAPVQRATVESMRAHEPRATCCVHRSKSTHKKQVRSPDIGTQTVVIVSIYPTPRHTLPEPSVTIEEDDGDITGTSSGSPAGLGKSTDEINDYPAKDVPATAENRRRDSHSSPSLTLRPASKKADQRTTLNTDTPRSPSLEPYAESTDSTTYAVLTLEAGVGGDNYFPPPPTPSSKRLYAAVAASSPSG